VNLFEWRQASFIEHKDSIHAFRNYLAGVWQNRARYLEGDDAPSEEEIQEEKIQKQRFFDFTFDGKISARNYVGVVQFEGIRIEVYPKIFAGKEEVNESQWQLNLLFWLSYCRKIRFPFSFADVSKMQFDDFLELLIYIFANYTSEILANQPFQAYQTVEEELPFLKGSLSFDIYTKHNLSTGNWQHFYCTHQPFEYDNQFNRIVKYVTRRLLGLSGNYFNQERLSEILFLLDEVSDFPCTASDCDQVKLNPLYEDHQHILALCRLFLSNQVMDMESDESKNFCFLVPMEYVFEEFLFGFISNHWPQLNIRSQSTDYLSTNKSRAVFQIRNDMYIKEKLIIDTKYKIRHPGNDGKEGVSQNDLYQMVSYAIRRNCKEVLLIYPLCNKDSSPAQFDIPSKMYSVPIKIHIHDLDITFQDIRSAIETIKERITHINYLFNE